MTGHLTGSVLLISPHLDDAAFSCGGLILKLVNAGQMVTVATVFAGSPGDGATSLLGRRLAGPMKPDVWISERRDEDARALTGVGAVVRHGGFVDAAFRRDPGGKPMYRTWRSIFAGTWRLHDQQLIDRIVAQLACWSRETRADRIVAPLGYGHHVDHLLVHQATVKGDWLSSDRLCFYEDLPYSADSCRPSVPERFARAMIVPIDLAAKLTLVGQYRVGLGTAERPDVTTQAIERHARSGHDANEIPAERYWHGHDLQHADDGTHRAFL